MRASVPILLGLVFGLLALPATSQTRCDVTYRVQAGDTIFSVAERHYADPEKWTLLYYANQASMRGSAEVSAGQDLYIPCPADGLVRPAPAPAAEPAPVPAPETDSGASADVLPVSASVQAELTLLTGGNYAPFTDQGWPSNGLATELVMAALAASPAPVEYAIAWENDWARHLYPLLDAKTYDMGFPWFRPDCAGGSDNAICSGFHFSDALMDVPIMLFKREDSDFAFAREADIAGARLCRPMGYSVHDLDRADRRWLSDGVITLLQPESPEACFEALMAGDVDAVSVDVFLGATKIVAMGLRGRAVPVDQPLGEEGLHVVISRTHARGTTHLYRINAGLAALREGGQYEEIVDRHMAIFWDQLR